MIKQGLRSLEGRSKLDAGPWKAGRKESCPQCKSILKPPVVGTFFLFPGLSEHGGRKDSLLKGGLGWTGYNLVTLITWCCG